MLAKQVKKPLMLLVALVMGHSSIYAISNQDDLTVSKQGQLLRFWFNPKHGWRAKSYDQRYRGCTRQQVHRVYTTDVVGLPSMLKNPNNLHWLKDPEQAGKEALYVGRLGLPGGMLARRAIRASNRDLKDIVETASRHQFKRLQRGLEQADAETDFHEVYEEVFGGGSSEEQDLRIFDLTVGGVRGLINYSQLFGVGLPQGQDEEKGGNVGEDGVAGHGGGMPSSAGQAMGSGGLIKHLRKRYKQDNQLPRLLDDKAQSLESYYVCLVMRTIQDTRQQQSQARRKLRQNLGAKSPDDEASLDQGRSEASLDRRLLYKVKNPIALRSLWKGGLLQSDKRLRHCCILGQAGSGKTTMTRYITYQWAQGKLWQDRFAWVLCIPLHWVHMLKGKGSVPELLARQWRCQVEHLERLLKRPKGLIILDGWDEVVELLQGQEPHPLERFLGQYSSQEGISWLTTSRPYATLPTHLEADRRCDLLGFEQADVAQYVEKYFGKGAEQGYELLKRLEDLPELRLLSRVPLYTRFLCLLKRKAPELLARREHLSVSRLYHKLVRSFLRYSMGKHYGTANVEHRTDRWLDKACASMYAYLGELAFRGLAEGQIMISTELQHQLERNVKTAYSPGIHAQSYRQKALSTGLLRALGEGDTPVHFPHLSLQEWFAAYHIAQSLYAATHQTTRQRACKVLQQYTYDVRYRQVIPLAAGLLYQRYVDGEDKEAYGLHVFWYHVLSDPQDLVGIHQIALNMHCMEACGADTKGVLSKLHRPVLDDVTLWLLAAWDVKTRSGLTPGLLPVLEHVWRRCPCVLSYGPLVEGLLNKLKAWLELPQLSEQVALGTLRALRRWLSAAWPSDVREALSCYALAGCKHRSEDVREVTAEALSKALEGASWDSRQVILKSLKTLCSDRDFFVRCEAAGALSKALEGQVSEQAWKGIVETLTKLCKDYSEWVRREAAAGLSTALEGVYSEVRWRAMMKALHLLCKDGSEWARKAAVRGLSKALERCSEEVRQLIVETLRSLCKDEDSEVRKAALGGLSKVLDGACSEQTWQAVVGSLKALCQDDQEDVCVAASEVLSKALVGVCSEGLWRRRVEVFKDLCKAKDIWIHWKAAKGFSRALEGASEVRWQVIIETLEGLCKEGYIGVRSAATEGLAKGLEGACSEEMKQAILKTLRGLSKDEAWIVRKAATEGLSRALLGACSEESWRAMVASLSFLCKDEAWIVRKAAAEGLSRALLGACSEENWRAMVASLSFLCRDNSEWVRSAAAEGLSKALEGKYADSGWQVRVESLMLLCQDQSYRVREAALRGLSKALRGKCSGEWQRILEPLRGLSRDREWMVRRAALRALSGVLEGKCSERAWKVIVETFTSLCKDPYRDVRESAAFGLSGALEGVRSDEDWRGIVETFRGLCKDENWEMRSAGAFGLSKALVAVCSEESWQARVETLRGLCKDNSELVRSAAAEGLSGALVGGCSKEAWEGVLEIFADLCQDNSELVRSVADQALVRAMREQKLLVRVLMSSESPSSTLIKAIATYSPCLVLPASCDERVADRIKQSLAQEHKARGWPVELQALKIQVVRRTSERLRVASSSMPD